MLSPTGHTTLLNLLCRYAALPQPPYTCPIDVSYNNIFLINAVNLIVIGEALLDLGYGANAAAAVTNGYALLDAWFAYASANGVHEYTSPTYSWVQLQAM